MKRSFSRSATPSTPRVPKYRLHRASGQAIVQHCGQRHYLGKYGTEASRERYALFIAELVASPTSAPPSHLLNADRRYVSRIEAAERELSQAGVLKVEARTP